MSTPFEIRRRNRRLLVTMFAIPALTLAAAWGLFRYTAEHETWGTTNNGELLDPVLDLKALTLSAIEPAGSDMLPEHWLLVRVQSRGCDDACDQALLVFRQMHVLLNKDADRVRRVYITGADDPDEAADLIGRYPKMLAYRLKDPSQLPDGTYLVDPQGRAILRYTQDQVGKPLQRDLQRLLKVFAG